LAKEWYIKGLNTLIRSDFRQDDIEKGEKLMEKIETLAHVGCLDRVYGLKQAWERKRDEVQFKEDELRKEYERKEVLRRQEANQKVEQKAAIRLTEVNRCKAVGSARTTGYCTDNRCRDQEDHDFCTYYHPYHDLPPHCQYFESGKCFKGDNCPFNHLRYS
jgi:hypothetical protein